jgi:hypothetical protein
MKLLKGGSLDEIACTLVDVERAKRRVMRYHWQEDTFYFENLEGPKPKDRFLILKKMHIRSNILVK